MSLGYDPDEGTIPVSPWTAAFLAERDVSIRVPINSVIQPGVSITRACFAHNQFEERRAAKCLSNLLAIGYRRFVLDIFWDPGRQIWALCPAQIPDSASNEDDDNSIVLIPPSTEATLQSATFAAHIERDLFNALPTPPVMSGNWLDAIFARQESSTPFTSKNTISTTEERTSISSSSITERTTSTPITVISASPIPFPPSTGQQIIEVGPYRCTSTIDLHFLVSIFSDYLQKTATTIQAELNFLTINVHAAISFSNASETDASSGSSLPTPDQLLSAHLRSNLSSFLYTPNMLREDRANLNASWFDVVTDRRPDSSYFSTSLAENDIFTTLDGWPSESFIEFDEYARLIAGFGTIDPQMSDYNLSGDADTIFPSEYTMSVHNVSLSKEGNVERGCIFDEFEKSVSSVNSSWAVSSRFASSDSDFFHASISNLTSCGISPLLNTTIANHTADEDFLPYQSFAYATIWSWLPGEPRNMSTESNESNPDDNSLFRCATAHASLNGRWRVSDCTKKHHAACRVGNEPYIWTIAKGRSSYSSSAETCPGNSTFAVPRTPLENRYLLKAIKEHADGEEDDSIVWINMNSLDVQDCWVSGVNTTCPYVLNEQDERSRTVIVPTVAAVVVFVIAALTVFVKCAANRQNSKRRRKRVREGWEYEGVPS